PAFCPAKLTQLWDRSAGRLGRRPQTEFGPVTRPYERQRGTWAVGDHNKAGAGPDRRLAPPGANAPPKRLAGRGIECGNQVGVRHDEGRAVVVPDRTQRSRLVHHRGSSAPAVVRPALGGCLRPPCDLAPTRVERDELAVRPLGHHDGPDHGLRGRDADHLGRPAPERPIWRGLVALTY